jgi:hypothetical protein
MSWRMWAWPVAVDPGSPGWGGAIRRLSLCPPRTAALFRSAVANKDWHAKVDGGGVAGAAVELDQLVVGGGEADLQED